MGIFGSKNTKLGTVYIKFYGENVASVEYETKITDKKQKESDLIQLFPLYYAKMLFNLNRGEFADNLIVYIQGVIPSVLNKKGQLKRTNIILSGQKLIEPKSNGITKKYLGELYENQNEVRYIQTHIDWGGENYYSPISTIVFIQYLINNLSKDNLISLLLIITGMNRYYQEADYSKLNSINDAHIYGLEFALQALKNIKNK